MRTRATAGLFLVAMLCMPGCEGGKPAFRASVDIFVAIDVRDPFQTDGNSSTNWFNAQAKLLGSDTVLGAVVEELKLDTNWAVPRAAALDRLRRHLYVSASPYVRTSSREQGGLVLSATVTEEGQTETENIVVSVARNFKKQAEQVGSKHIAEQLARVERELDAAQEKLAEAKSEVLQLQTNLFVPSRYRLSKEYEEETQAKIGQAAKEESQRAGQLESLRKMQGEELRAALVKIELARLASPEVATNPAASTSMLLTVNQAQKVAQKDLELAQAGTLNETNALAHAQLKLELANQNLAATMDASMKSLEIELEVCKTRRQELTTQLEKLREAARRAERKDAIEKEIKGLNSRITALTSEVGRWNTAQRMLAESIQIGPTEVVPTRMR